MDQPIQPIETAPRAETPTDTQDRQRAALMHALSAAEQIVSELHPLPTDVVLRADRDAYGVHLWFRQSKAAVLEFAATFEAPVTSGPSPHGDGFVESRVALHGIEVVAWTTAEAEPTGAEPVSDQPVDEDPIAYALIEQTDQAVKG
ncbi:hypothetical protein ACRJ4B_49955 [Streptomyces sp. GTA36]